MFTGDRSGDFLYAHLYRAGFASQPHSAHRDDGLTLHDAYITAVARCAPPANLPLPSEIADCSPYLEAELDIIRPRAVLALGAVAFGAYIRTLVRRGELSLSDGNTAERRAYRFAHGAEFQLPGNLPRLFASYHPSQQNTQTGRLTSAMFMKVLRRIRRALGAAR
jgi:uracil-DNA glycosylase family 4